MKIHEEKYWDALICEVILMINLNSLNSYIIIHIIFTL